MKSTPSLALAVILGTCGFAAAQEKPKRSDRPIAQEMLKKFDKDGDGKLSDEERKAMREDMRAVHEKREAEMLKKFDTDGDGKLSDEEKKARRETMAAKRKELLEKYDADKDGKLSPEEIKTARDAGEELPMGGGPDGPRGKKGDRDGEGSSPAE